MTRKRKTVTAPAAEATMPVVPAEQGGELAASTPSKMVKVHKRDAETDGQAIARTHMHPVTNAVMAMMNFSKTPDVVGVIDMVREVGKHVTANDMERPETILLCQALTLDTIFNKMADMAGANFLEGRRDASEQYLRMALKAQVQCRATIETLAEVKNPRAATFVKQQNVAHQQQINNGVPAPVSRTRAGEKDLDDPSNKLLEADDGKRMDTGAASTPGGTDTELGAVGKVDRPANGRRKRASR